MKKKVVLLFLSICMLFFSALDVLAVPEINHNASSEYLDYGKGHRFDLVVYNLTIDTEYTAMVANNTNDAYNITFTAKSTIAEIHIDYHGTKQDLYNNSLTQLQVFFVEGTTVHFTYYITLKYDNTLASLVAFGLDLLVFSLTLFLGGLIVILIARKF